MFVSDALTSVSSSIAALATLQGQERKRAAYKVIEGLRDNNAVPQLLGEYLENVVDGKIPHQSNFNPNGFYKINIAKTEASALRLHVAHSTVGIPEEGRIEENAHDHRWSLYSLSLAGHIAHEILGIAKNPKVATAEKLTAYSYGPRGGKEVYEMSHLGEAYLNKTGEKNPAAGEITVLDSYTIHRASYPNQDEFTATLVVTDEDRGRLSNNVYVKDDINELIQNDGSTTPTPKISLGTTVSVVLTTIEEMHKEEARQAGISLSEEQLIALRLQCFLAEKRDR
jgi:hypothetical protein